MITTLAAPHQAAAFDLGAYLAWYDPRNFAERRQGLAHCLPAARSGHSAWLARQCLSVACHGTREDRAPGGPITSLDPKAAG